MYHGSDAVRTEKRKMFQKLLQVEGTSVPVFPVVITSYEVRKINMIWLIFFCLIYSSSAESVNTEHVKWFLMCLIEVINFQVVIRDTRFLARYYWRYICVDEGHRIKNHNCRLTKWVLFAVDIKFSTGIIISIRNYF